MEFFSNIEAGWLVLLIPVISAFVGWFTNLVAIKMMLYPIEFIGIRPFLGWQGIIPSNALRLASFSTKLITEKLVSLEGLFEGFSAEAFAKENIGEVVDDLTEMIIEEVATKRAPLMWENAGDVMQEKVRERVREEVTLVAVNIARDLGDNITRVLDLEEVVIDAVTGDKALMGQMFLEVGGEEFKFIERSGLYFGLLFGIVQMVVWVLFPAWWILPVAGFAVGYVTNFLAIKMIFEPQEPKKFGPIVIQGLFHKRQAEVAQSFADLVAGTILNADNILKIVLRPESKAVIVEIVEGHVVELIDRYLEHPMASMALQEDEKPKIRAEVLARIQDELPKPGGLLHTFAGKAVSLREEMHDRMKSLDKSSFESILRPAFQQDEWKLIAIGAVLGAIAGVLQLVYIFGETLV